MKAGIPKMERKIPLLRPILPNTDVLIPYLREIDNNRWYTNFGPLVQRLESRLLDRFTGHSRKALYLTTVNNCTVGLELALAALGLPRGSAVLTPALTFVATATAILRSGHELVLADIDPQSWLLTPEAARTALQSHDIKAVMPVATFGCPQDTSAWDTFAEETGIPVILDAAGAFGNQEAGNSITVVFSTHATKTLSSAEGGVVISHDKGLVEAIRQLSNFGIDLSVATPLRQGLVTQVGTNAKMSEYHAAIALAALDQWEETSHARLELVRLYEEGLAPLSKSLVWQKTPGRQVNSLMPIRLASRIDLAPVIMHLKGAGVETRRWYCPPLHEHPAFADAARASHLAEAEALSASLLGLPFYLGMTKDEVDYVCASLKQALLDQELA